MAMVVEPTTVTFRICRVAVRYVPARLVIVSNPSFPLNVELMIQLSLLPTDQITAPRC
jgi:hypothetical protein